MNYYDRIQQSIDFIEANLVQPLTPQIVSRAIYSSLPHFYRVFTAMTGFSVKEYIRKRRLSCAAHELFASDRKIIEIALKYRYNSRQFRKSHKEQELFEPLNIFKQRLDYSALHIDIPRLITVNSFPIIGTELRAALRDGREAEEIPAFWERFRDGAVTSRIPAVNPEVFYGVYQDWNEVDALSLITCYEVAPGARPGKGLVSLTVPGAKYAVFSARGPVPDALVATWRYIYGEWFPQTSYERVKALDFERYDHFADPADAAVDIYIPVK